ncbi:hypothetical protein FRB93_009285 [Tulasnella sp. JGI-2019a]|nr:hypothetical protein FRB93_009285 [Tulasnella sp. JGI-2019a]
MAIRRRRLQEANEFRFTPSIPATSSNLASTSVSLFKLFARLSPTLKIPTLPPSLTRLILLDMDRRSSEINMVRGQCKVY